MAEKFPVERKQLSGTTNKGGIVYELCHPVGMDEHLLISCTYLTVALQ